ncbi:hypothetical protein Tco_0949585 [Tanacetum coccineum]
MPRECLKIIESKSKVCQSRSKAVVAKVSMSSSTPVVSPDIAELKDMVRALILDKKNQTPAPVKAVNQPPAYQAPVPQTHGVSKTDFDNYVKANDAVLRNMQNQGQTLQNQMANLTDMLSKFVTYNTASTSGLRTLSGNTITNSKEDLKGITTRSGVAYQGPAIPSTSSSPPKVMNRDTEVTKDMMLPTNNGSTEDVQPPVVQVQSQNPTSEPNVDPVSKLKTRWSGPFTVTQVFPYGTVELSQNSKPNFKVNGHRLKHYFGGDIPTEVVSDLQTFPKDN